MTEDDKNEIDDLMSMAIKQLTYLSGDANSSFTDNQLVAISNLAVAMKVDDIADRLLAMHEEQEYNNNHLRLQIDGIGEEIGRLALYTGRALV